VHNFASGLGGITWIGAGTDGCVWYIKYDQNELRRICYTLAVNLPPVAVATQNVSYGSGPLAVQFNGIASTDPENGALTYLWNFGDGQTSTSANPSHTFTSPVGVVTTRTVTLTVTDNINQSASVQLVVSVNNTPPTVNITSIPVNAFYPVGVDTTWTLEADVSDVEHGPAQLTYGWVTTLHHNTHSHTEPSDPAVVSSTLVSGVGCGHVETFYYEVSLTVTDAGGLATTQTRQLQPRCYAIPPTAMISASTSFGAGPLQVQLDGTMSYDPGTIVSYSWAFGDGTFSTSDAPFKIFTEEGDYVVTLTVTDDDGLTGQATKVISVISSVPPQCVGAAGSILREYFANIAGNNISDLVNSPNYPASPTTVSYPTSFKVSSSTQSNFGTRLRGYIVPPTSGTYTFTSTSDDQSLVYLSPNADPQFKQVICSILGYTGETEYTKYASQTSAPIQLEAGRYYYVEMLQKEGSGGDHMALHWQTPNNSTRAVVPGSVLVRWQDCSPSVRVRMALQGPYDGGTGLMNDDLRIAGYIPTVEPYTALGYQMIGGSGNTVSPATLAVTGINAVVDWVLVELRSAAAPSVIVSTRTALLQRDGDVVGTDGYSRLIFNVVSNNYYVAVRHRNHLSVMTGASVTLNNALAVVDMTSTAQATYGTNAQKIFTNGKRGMWCGNVNSDNRLMYTGSSNDRDLILTRIGGIIPTNTVLGYYREDVNMNGNVRYTGSGNDRDLILLNIGGIVPTSVKMEQLP
ncbi:MAG TPA: PKD domain-containing protein, partial [Flavobacteriales bacterium]|nr:PKD domain-containing protein [Flavobacteriales bacterium]